tara:strand:- start:1384 stop:3303 length:1920 start_codon:yes stop_codon:yes gene_type:complete
MGIRLKGQTTGFVEIEAPATAADNTLKLPNGNGSNGQMLTTDGNGNLSFTTPASTDLVTDPTPQLGGDLDVDGNDIVSTSNGDINLDPNGSGQVVFKGNSTRGSGAIKLNCENNSHGILVKGPPHSAGASYTLTLPNDTGTSGQLLSTDGLGTTTWTTVNASPSYSATASGAIANGDTLIVKTNGDLAPVAKSVTEITPANSTVTNSGDCLELASTSYKACYASGSQAVVFVARKNSASETKARAIFVDGTTHTFSNVAAVDGGNKENYAIAYDSTNDRVVFFYLNSANTLFAKVGTIPTTASSNITLGPEVQIDTSVDEEPFDATFDVNAGKVVVVYRGSSDTRPHIAVGTVNPSDNSITFGTIVNAVSTAGRHNSIVYDANAQKHVHLYRNSSGDLEAKVFTVSGTSGSYGSSAATITTIDPEHTQGCFDSVNNKVVFITKDGGDSNEAKCVVGNVSGDSVTFGSPIDISNGQTSTVSIDFDSDAGKPVLGYVDNLGSYYFTRVSISGTTPTAETPRDTGTNAHNHSVSLTYHKAAERVILTGADVNNGYGFGYTIKMTNISTNLTADNYIGIADAAYSNGATATAQIVGSINDAQSGLTPGKKYYVQTDGRLDIGAANPSVVAGTAVSATKLIVKG